VGSLERARARMQLGKWEDARADAQEYLRLAPAGAGAAEAAEIAAEAKRRLEGS
jgi:hypothetical protein